MRIAVIFNSKIKRRNQVYEELLKLERTNVAEQLEFFDTEYVGHGIELAKNASPDFNCIVAAGGDGTLNEVVNGIMLSEIPKENRPVLAHYPCGSANDYARSVLIDHSIEYLIELARKQHTHPIDIGKVTYLDENAIEKTRYFVNILDCGIGAEVVNRVNSSRKTLGVSFTFLRAITSAFLTYQKSTIHVKTEKEEFTDKVLTQVFAIGKYFGNGICIAPDAKPDNGIFQAITIGDASFTDYALNLRKLKKGQKVVHPKMTIRKCTQATITPDEYSCAVETDGEFLGFAPLKIEMLMHEMKLLCYQFPK